MMPTWLISTEGMKRSFRKLNRDDFFARIDTVDRLYRQRTPYFRRRDRTGEAPVKWTVIGFVWSWLVFYIAQNRTHVEIMIGDSTLPRYMHDPAMASVAAGLSISFILLGYHILRGLARARGYYNSGSLLVGFIAAAVLHALPADVYRGAYDMLDDETQQHLARTVDKVRDVDWQRVVAVSSQGTPLELEFNRASLTGN